jgi:hypothetical protein
MFRPIQRTRTGFSSGTHAELLRRRGCSSEAFRVLALGLAQAFADSMNVVAGLAKNIIAGFADLGDYGVVKSRVWTGICH